MPLSSKPNQLVTLLIVASLLWGCQTTEQTASDERQHKTEETEQVSEEMEHKTPSKFNRPVPNLITGEIPNAFFNAVDQNTRTMSGEPGREYWTQWTHYELNAEIVPADTLLKGEGTITYYNNSPDTLNQLLLELSQNVHQEGVPRNEAQEVTGGVNLEKIAVGEKELSELLSPRENLGYAINGTQFVVRPGRAVFPGDSISIEIAWNFKIPQQGAGGRMGYSEDNLFYIGYWYPQMRVYDDVIGWMTDPFRGNAEFYHGFANYDVDITVPEQWLVGSTGQLTNADEVLTDEIYDRMQEAYSSDSVVPVVSEDDFGNVTKSNGTNSITWSFRADTVRDFAFSATKESIWDATRASVGDRDGDGQENFSQINAIYRSSAPLWTNGAEFTQNAITFLSNYTGLEYPWPHMTSVEGGGIIGGGMEFPMMTIIGSYKGQPAQSLYAVIAHELAHMWMPMIVSSNERRYSWMDEGTTTFSENQAKKAYYPEGPDFDQQEYQSYLQIAGSDMEGPIMRWSDFHYNGFAFGIASYPKPASMLVSLRHILGEETFNEAMRTFFDRWKYKHPYPWDLFNTFEDVAGRDLDWFWRSWYYETWTLDQAVGSVTTTDNETRIVIEDRGEVPMPATVEITMSDGSTQTQTIPVETWLKGATQATITVEGEVSEVEIDPENHFPDTNRSNNSWYK